MVTDAEIKRINELAKKAKESGLTASEKEEQQALRQKYIDAVKTSLRANLDNIKFVDEEDNKPKH
ncbi:DUF896 domain-containing protein [Brevibacillus dissolubilis]|uniref:DUF896 domain-containing protein n=1 Tax=Brevibacillus dissolubilis TaxID=1844116 RepID=UPI00111689DE|nr:DUF896 domain-containing protein [Brevibacillus dissolubilis]